MYIHFDTHILKGQTGRHYDPWKVVTYNIGYSYIHSRTYCDRCPTSDMSDLKCQTTGRMETGAIKRVIKLES